MLKKGADLTTFWWEKRCRFDKKRCRFDKKRCRFDNFLSNTKKVQIWQKRCRFDKEPYLRYPTSFFIFTFCKASKNQKPKKQETKNCQNILYSPISLNSPVYHKIIGTNLWFRWPDSLFYEKNAILSKTRFKLHPDSERAGWKYSPEMQSFWKGKG